MAQNSKKVLVTGGAGFIGSNLVGRLLRLGYNVRVVDNFSTGKRENIKEFLNYDNFEFIKGDLRSLNTCRKITKGIEYIFHLAAIPSVQRSVEDPITSNESNVSGTLNLLVAARDEGHIKKLVYSSSSSVYGDLKKLPKSENQPIGPISPYALSKYAGERYCQIFYKIYNLPTICLRYFNVFGPNQNPNSQYSAVIPKFVSSVIHKKQPIIYGDGEQSRDFTYIDNVVEANILAAFSNVSGEVINIACNKRTSLNKILKIINHFLKTNVQPIYKPARVGDIKHSLADISKAKKLLKFNPKISIEDGLKRFIFKILDK